MTGLLGLPGEGPWPDQGLDAVAQQLGAWALIDLKPRRPMSSPSTSAEGSAPRGAHQRRGRGHRVGPGQRRTQHERCGADRRGPHRAAPPLGRQPQAACPVRLGRRTPGVATGRASASPPPTGSTWLTLPPRSNSPSNLAWSWPAQPPRTSAPAAAAPSPASCAPSWTCRQPRAGRGARVREGWVGHEASGWDLSRSGCSW
jgi:hypothetical protein